MSSFTGRFGEEVFAMTRLRLTCPRCGYSRTISSERIPTGKVKAICPSCNASFPLHDALRPHEDTLPEPQPGPRPSPSPPLPDFLPPHEPAEEPPAPGPDGGDVPPAPHEPKTALSPIRELFARSWDIYTKRFATLISLYLLTIASLFLPLVVFLGIGALFARLLPASRDIFIAAGGIAGLLTGLAVAFLAYSGFVCGVADERLGTKGALVQGWRMYASFAWLYTILAFIIGGGWLLFIIPGILFSVWFLFPPFILAMENVRGMDALLKSREYARGHTPGLLGRLFLVWLASFLLRLIPYAGPLLSILAAPFVMVYSNELYRELREIKGDVAFRSGSGETFKWVGIALLGYFIMPLLLIVAFAGTILGFIAAVAGNLGLQ